MPHPDNESLTSCDSLYSTAVVNQSALSSRLFPIKYVLYCPAYQIACFAFHTRILEYFCKRLGGGGNWPIAYLTVIYLRKSGIHVQYRRKIQQFRMHSYKLRGVDSSVGIGAGYGLDGVWVSVEARFCSSACRPNRLWGHPTYFPILRTALSLGVKMTWAWGWPFTSN
jgi:hypothetical protein